MKSAPCYRDQRQERVPLGTVELDKFPILFGPCGILQIVANGVVGGGGCVAD